MRIAWLETVGARLVAVIVAVAVPLAAGMAFMGWRALEETRTLAASLLQANANQAARMIGDFQAQTLTVIERLASRPAIRELSPGACDDEKAALEKYGSDYLLLTLWRADGTYVCSTIPPAPEAPAPKPNLPLFAAALSADGLRLSDVYTARATGRPAVAFSEPVRDEAGRTVGVVFVVVRLEYFDRILLALDHRAGSVAAILDRKGTIVARVPDSPNWRGRSGVDYPAIRAAMAAARGHITMPGADGVERSAYFLEVPGTGWRVIYGIGTEQLYAGFHRTLVGGSILFAVALLASLTAALVLSRQVRQPLERLAAVAEALGKGDTARRADVSGPREVARVALQFNRMIDALQAEAAERRLNESNLAEAQRLTHLGSWELDLADPADLDRNPLRWSDETFRIFGYQPGEIAVTRENFLLSVHPEDRERIDAALVRSIEQGVPYDVEHRVLRPDGTERIVREYAEPSFDAARGVHKIIGTVRDVTEEQRAARSLQAAHDRLRVVSVRLLRAEEAERLRISQDLHDQVGQELTALKIVIDNLARSADSKHLAAQLAEAAALAGETLQRVRQISVDLRPPLLDALGVVPALQALLERQAAVSGLPIHLDLGPMPRRTTPEVEITVFRIAQEATNNILKHARAANAWVRLATAAERITLEVRDDGVGFDPEAQRQRSPLDGTLGFLGMEERVSLVGGRLDILSMPGHGCIVSATLPFPPPESS